MTKRGLPRIEVPPVASPQDAARTRKSAVTRVTGRNERDALCVGVRDAGNVERIAEPIAWCPL